MSGINEGVIVTIVGSVVTTIVSIVILRFLRYFEKKQDRKAEEVKSEAVLSAAKVKANVEEMAKELTSKTDEKNKNHMEETARIADDLKVTMTRMTSELLTSVFNSNTEAQKKNIEQSNTIIDKIQSVDSRLSSMISALQHKSHLTNGNIKIIREDLLELQEDMDLVFDRVNMNAEALQSPSSAAAGGAMNPITARQRARRRKLRKKQIDDDAKAQHQRSYELSQAALLNPPLVLNAEEVSEDF